MQIEEKKRLNEMEKLRIIKLYKRKIITCHQLPGNQMLQYILSDLLPRGEYCNYGEKTKDNLSK